MDAVIAASSFEDLLLIGTGEPRACSNSDVSAAYALVIEGIDARITKLGHVLARPDSKRSARRASLVWGRGREEPWLEIAVLFAHKNPKYEARARAARLLPLRNRGPPATRPAEKRAFARTSTAVPEAFLGSTLSRCLGRVSSRFLPGSQLLVMQSSGRLVEARGVAVGPAAILSGPAGGVVAATKIAEHYEARPTGDARHGRDLHRRERSYRSAKSWSLSRKWA